MGFAKCLLLSDCFRRADRPSRSAVVGERSVSGAEREGEGARRRLQATYSRAGLFAGLLLVRYTQSKSVVHCDPYFLISNIRNNYRSFIKVLKPTD